jgi:hypothetical protein
VERECGSKESDDRLFGIVDARNALAWIDAKEHGLAGAFDRGRVRAHRTGFARSH